MLYCCRQHICICMQHIFLPLVTDFQTIPVMPSMIYRYLLFKLTNRTGFTLCVWLVLSSIRMRNRENFILSVDLLNSCNKCMIYYISHNKFNWFYFDQKLTPFYLLQKFFINQQWILSTRLKWETYYWEYDHPLGLLLVS